MFELSLVIGVCFLCETPASNVALSKVYLKRFIGRAAIEDVSAGCRTEAARITMTRVSSLTAAEWEACVVPYVTIWIQTA